jgi:hypothetical protein
MEIREVILLLFDVCWKLLKSGVVFNGTIELRYPESLVAGMGIILLVGTLFYAIPKTIFIGALLLVLMFFLDGAIATHLHIKPLNLVTPYTSFTLGYSNGALKNAETAKTGNFYKIKYQFIFKI